ncbi:adenylate kinase-domain-containing protein [Chaetomium tenue]|uniref:Adenylate kinase-domain-containing protein n=1 Tax=Chaetomium tenue TaxID=1854479 RepID=A0ACB7PC68_9PEZI|nr:adenylate kinase-domain-containing protein [Chaetomium globosum]
MLGGPGSGKGTQCKMLSQRFDFTHISIGDVLRQEINRPGSQYADILRENILAGKIGAKEMTVSILRDEMLRWVAKGTRCFVLDGFPRSKVQCDYFEQLIGPIALLIVLDCPEATMMARLAVADRNRFDDNTTGIRKRIETFQKTTSEVIDEFRGRGKLYSVNSDQEPGVVVLELEAILDGLVNKRTGLCLDI